MKHRTLFNKNINFGKPKSKICLVHCSSWRLNYYFLSFTNRHTDTQPNNYHFNHMQRGGGRCSTTQTCVVYEAAANLVWGELGKKFSTIFLVCTAFVLHLLQEATNSKISLVSWIFYSAARLWWVCQVGVSVAWWAHAVWSTEHSGLIFSNMFFFTFYTYERYLLEKEKKCFRKLLKNVLLLVKKLPRKASIQKIIPLYNRQALRGIFHLE